MMNNPLRNLFRKIRDKGVVVESTDVEVQLNEKDLVLQKLKKEDLSFQYRLSDPEGISLYLANLLVTTHTLLSYLNNNFVTSETLQKINKGPLSISDLISFELGLLEFDIFREEDKELINNLRKDVSDLEAYYYGISVEELSVETEIVEEIPVYTESFFDGENILVETKKGIPLKDKITYDPEKIDIYMPIDTEQIFYHEIFSAYYSDKLEINKNSVIVITIDKFKELIKDENNLKILENSRIILKDDFDKYNNFRKQMLDWRTTDRNHFEGEEVNSLLVKINHLLEVIDKSNLTEEKKKYYVYKVQEIYFSDYNREFIFGLTYSLKPWINRINEKVSTEELKKITNEFNEKDITYKTREITPVKLSAEIFLSQFDNLDAVSSFKFFDAFTRVSSELRKDFLNSPIVLKKLQGLLKESENDEYSYYEKMAFTLTIEEIFKIFDGEFIRDYFQDNINANEYRFFYTISKKDINKVVEMLFIDEIYFEEFIKDIHRYNFSKINYDNLIKLLKKIDETGRNIDLSFLGTVDKSKQFNLLKENFNNDFLVKIVTVLDKEVQQFFYLEDKRFSYLFDKFNLLALSEQKYKMPDDVIYRDDFLDKFKCSSLTQFRVNVNKFLSNQPSIYFKEKVERYVDNLINDYDVNVGMFKQYQELIENIERLDEREFIYGNKDFLYNHDVNYKIRDKNCIRYDANDKIQIRSRERLEESLKEVSKNKLSELVIDRLFEDNIYNVFINIKEMIRFDARLAKEEKVLTEGQIEFYKMILKIDKLEGDKIKKIYDKFKGMNVSLMFYQDLQKMKYKAYDKIKEEMIQPENMEGLEDKELSERYGVPVFDFREKEYVMLARCLGTTFSSNWRNNRDCYTLLSNENSDVFHPDDYVYGYSGFDNDCVLHMFEEDAFSADAQKYSNLSAGSDRVNRLMTSHELATNSGWYSEVQIVNKKNDNERNLFEALRPSFLVAYDEISPKILEEAKRMRVPIFIITNNMKLDLENKVSFDKNMDTYIVNYIVNENERLIGRLSYSDNEQGLDEEMDIDREISKRSNR